MNRTKIFYFVVFLICGSLLFRLYQIQIKDETYKLRGYSNSVQTVKKYPSRGNIYDRNGELLVSSKITYNLSVVPNKINNFDTLLFCEIFKTNKSEFDTLLKNCIKQNTKHNKSVFYSQITDLELAFFQENIYKFQGFSIERGIEREYHTQQAGNILGYIGKANLNHIKKRKDYTIGENIGITGIEKSYESYLRGKRGVKYNQRDARGRVIGSYKKGIFDSIAMPGQDLTTSIDIKLQKYGDSLMKNKRGGIVAIEPSSGEILAMVTSPSFSPDMMAGRNRSRNYSELLKDSVNKPLFDRSVLGAYPPGSPFKIITGLIGKQMGVITDSTHFVCKHGFDLGNRKLGCHCGYYYVPIGIKKATAKSCNNYFCQVYKKILNANGRDSVGYNMDKWREYVKSFGLGDYLHNDLSTGSKGLIPSQNTYNRKYGNKKWNATTVISNAIGQGEVNSTPIQLANMTAIVANRGWYYTPHIIKNINGKPNEKFTVKKYCKVEERHFETVIEGMYDVVRMGTARNIWNPNIKICGKTGTAENPHGEDHSIFVAFAPKDHPKIAVAVFIENGGYGSKIAAPISALMIENYLFGYTSERSLSLENYARKYNLKNRYLKQEIKRLERKGYPIPEEYLN